MATIDLREYGTWTGALDTEPLRALASVAGSRLGVRRDLDGRAVVSAGSHVGVIVAEGVTVRVRPKVPLDNLFYLLGVGDESWTLDPTVASFGARDDDIAEAVVRLFAVEVDRLTSRGLLHGYVTEEERILAVRGRVDMTAVMRRPWERTPVPCRYDEFVPDIWVNQVLVAALVVARRGLQLAPALRGELHLLAQRFEGVSHRSVDLDRLARWRPSRNDRRYRIALRLAEIILHNLSLVDRAGDRMAAAFTLDMNQLFETFVGRELARRLPDGLVLSEQHRTTLDMGGRREIRPDLVLHHAGQPWTPLAVGDIKYKLTESLGSTPDHYQLLAYTTVFGLDDGVLFYCEGADVDTRLESAPPVSSIVVRGRGSRHVVYRLDVSGTRSDISRRLDALAAWWTQRLATDGADGADGSTRADLVVGATL